MSGAKKSLKGEEERGERERASRERLKSHSTSSPQEHTEPLGACQVSFVMGEERWSLSAPVGTSLFQLARANEIPVQTLCHGIGACVRCKVKVLEGELSPLTPVERDKMGNIYHLTRERMACQAKLVGDVLLELSAPRRKRAR